MGKPHRSTIFFFFTLIATLTWMLASSSLAFADENNAEQLFQEGLAAMKRSDYPTACEAFAASNKSDPSPGTQINLAVCFEKQKKWASSWTWYRSAVGLAAQRGQKERELLAEDSANKLKTQLHYVIISIKEPLSDLVVKRDGAEVTITLAGKEVPLPIDPGEHSIEVTAKGKVRWQTTIKMPDNNLTDRVEVPKLVNAPVDDKAAGGGGGGADYRPPIIVANDGSGQRTVGIVVAGAGVLAALACGGVFILANQEADERDKNRAAANAATTPAEKESFTRSGDSHNKAAVNDQLIGIIIGVSAGVLVAVGGVLYFTAKSSTTKTAGSTNPPKKQLVPVPILGSGLGGLGLAGTF